MLFVQLFQLRWRFFSPITRLLFCERGEHIALLLFIAVGSYYRSFSAPNFETLSKSSALFHNDSFTVSHFHRTWQRTCTGRFTAILVPFMCSQSLRVTWSTSFLLVATQPSTCFTRRANLHSSSTAAAQPGDSLPAKHQQQQHHRHLQLLKQQYQYPHPSYHHYHHHYPRRCPCAHARCCCRYQPTNDTPNCPQATAAAPRRRDRPGAARTERAPPLEPALSTTNRQKTSRYL